jgi:signal transduction histidine kinase
VVVAVFATVVAAGAWYAFRQIDRLTADLRERNVILESRNAVLRAVYDVSVAVSGHADPDSTIGSIVENCRVLLKADAVLLALDGPPGTLRLRAASAAAGVLASGAPAGSGYVSPTEDDLGCYLQPGYQIGLMSRVGHGEKRVGTLGVAIRADAPRDFDVFEVETLSALATQVGLALEAARLHNELQVLAIQGERERIARDMHDGLAQVLGYVNTKSQAVEELLADDRVLEARRQLEELAAAARSVYLDVREAILSLSTPVEPDRGLAAALEEYAASYSQSAHLAVRFRVSPDAAMARLSAAAQAEVFSIAREALTNVRKHAHARRVSLTLAVEGRELVLSVKDDGVGFGAAGLAAGPEHWPHFGLAGMRERAESIGGRILWHSRPGAGTQVELHVPVGGPRVGGSILATPRQATRSPGGTGRSARRHQVVRSPAIRVSEAD